MRGIFLGSHNYRTCRVTDLIRCSFSSLTNSLKTQLFIFIFFNFLKGFHRKEMFWEIITTVLVVLKSRSGVHFLRCQILQSSLLFFFSTSLRGFIKNIFFGNCAGPDYTQYLTSTLQLRKNFAKDDTGTDGSSTCMQFRCPTFVKFSIRARATRMKEKYYVVEFTRFNPKKTKREGEKDKERQALAGVYVQYRKMQKLKFLNSISLCFRLLSSTLCIRSTAYVLVQMCLAFPCLGFTTYICISYVNTIQTVTHVFLLTFSFRLAYEWPQTLSVVPNVTRRQSA